MKNSIAPALMSVVVACVCVEGARAQDAAPGSAIEPLATQQIALVQSPVWCGSPPGDRSRLFVLSGQRSGSFGTTPLWVVSITRPVGAPPVYALRNVPFVQVQGAAFAPDYETSGYLYLAHEATWQGGSGSVVTRYHRSAANPDAADPDGGVTIIRFPNTSFDHAVGSMHFGADGYLYVGVGDGFNSANGESTGSLNGKMLRIDVNGDDFPDDATRSYRIPPGNPYPVSDAPNASRPEVLDVGLRNPWRWSFDRATGDMWIGDVGQGIVEEVDVLRGVGGAPSMALWNFGWPLMEGTRYSGDNAPYVPFSRVAKPVISYTHGQQRRGDELRGYTGFAVTGGVVYRGAALPSMRGRYLLADYMANWLLAFSARYPTLPPVNVAPMLGRTATGAPAPSPSQVVSFGEDADGEVYICEYGFGRVRKIVPLAPPAFQGGPEGVDGRK